MSEQAEIFFERLDQRREELKLSDRALSLAAGASQDLIRTARNKGHVPNAGNLAGIAKALGVTTDWLLGRDDSLQEIRSDAEFGDARTSFEYQRIGDLPVLGTGHCANVTFGTNGDAVEIEQTQFEPTTIIRFVARPPALMGVKEAYSIYFVGESMQPRYNPGEMGFVDPRRPPSNGDDVVVQLLGENTDEITSILVKRLVRRTSEFLMLEQYNPATIFKVPMRRVARIHRLVPAAELFGA